MQTGHVALAAVPGRAEPDHRAELVNQLLYGEEVTIIHEDNDWLHVMTLHDEYLAWVRKNQIMPGPFPGPKNVLHSTLFQQTQCGWLSFGSFGGEISGRIHRTDMVAQAACWAQVPYLWGGRTPMGVDCSGFTQLIYRAVGISIPRDAWQQALCGTDVGFLGEAEPGDLAFFGSEDGPITHVGLLTGKGTIWHAHGEVREDIIDSQGIYNVNTKKHTHLLRVIKRIG